MKTIRVLLSGIAVYFLVAILHACGGSPLSAGAGGASSSGHATGGRGGAGGIMDPVDDAEAKSGSRLRQEYWLGEDGAREYLYAWHDNKRDEVCTVSGSQLDDKLRCLPSGTIGATYFSDAACLVPLSNAGKPMCGNPAYTYYVRTQDPPVACKQTIGHLFKSVAIYDPALPVYTVSGGACVATSAPMGQDLYTVGPEIPPTEFVAFTLTVD